MKHKCSKHKIVMKRRKSYPFGKKSKSRITYYCPKCQEENIKFDRIERR